MGLVWADSSPAATVCRYRAAMPWWAYIFPVPGVSNRAVGLPDNTARILKITERGTASMQNRRGSPWASNIFEFANVG